MIDGIGVPGRWCLLAALSTWGGIVLTGLTNPVAGIIAVIATGIVILAISRRVVAAIAAAFMLLGLLSGLVADHRVDSISEADLPQGRIKLTLRIVEESDGSRYGRAVGAPLAVGGIPWHGPRLAIEGIGPATVGTTMTVDGGVRPRVSRVRDEIVAGTVDVDVVLASSTSTNPVFVVGNLIRGRVASIYDDPTSGDGLLRGLLIGDTTLLSAEHEEDLRRSGLAHYIAVSGSNVAMFLVAWWFLTIPLAIRPILRIVSGLVGLAVFAVVTRWEPSVIRASVMAAVPLVGGLVGIPFDPWMALGAAVTVLLLASGHLAFSVGFQLSVAATIGVLIGVSVASGRRPSWFWMPLFATIGAQLLVAPIILAVFGTIPLLAPAANLVVAPIVATATAVAGIGLVLPVLAPLAGVGASIILAIAKAAAGGPQLGWLGAIASGVAALAVWWRPTRPLGVAAVASVLLLAVGSGTVWPSEPTMTALDVGQGDAILLQDPSGSAVLVDGGSEPRVLDRALRRHNVHRLDLLVVTHGDLDHVGGVVELAGSGRVAEFWVPDFAAEGGLLDDVIESAHAADVTVLEVAAGVRKSVGSLQIEVLGPRRRYLTENDGSVSLLVSAGRDVLLGGDIEAVAQAELPEVRPDILVVPHHGSGTTDLRWLKRTVGSVAVLSYGRNRYGHPDSEVVRVLGESGANVHHTHLEGDISFPLGWQP